MTWLLTTLVSHATLLLQLPFLTGNSLFPNIHQREYLAGLPCLQCLVTGQSPNRWALSLPSTVSSAQARSGFLRPAVSQSLQVLGNNSWVSCVSGVFRERGTDSFVLPFQSVYIGKFRRQICYPPLPPGQRTDLFPKQDNRCLALGKRPGRLVQQPSDWGFLSSNFKQKSHGRHCGEAI